MCLILSGFLFNSCVNKEYDLDKELDGTSVMLKDMTLPIGNLEKILIDDLLSVEQTNGMIVEDENGDYAFLFKSNEPFSAKFSIPTFQIPLTDDISSENYRVEFLTEGLAGLDASLIENQVLQFNNVEVEKLISIDENYLLPSQILDIKEAEVNTEIDYKFAVNAGAVYVKKGFSLDFPDWIVLEKTNNEEFFEIVSEGDNKNIIRLTEEIKVSSSTPFSIGLLIKKVNFPDGSIISGGKDETGKNCKKISLKDDNKINAGGDVYLHTKDFTIIPEKINFDMRMFFEEYEVKSAKVSLDMSMDLPDQSFPITGFPEMFDKEGVVIDLYDSFLSFDVANEIPVALNLNADLKAYKKSQEVMSMHLGDNAPGNKKFSIPGLWEGTIVYSRLGRGEGEIAMPELGQLINHKPDGISVSNIVVSSSDDYITITSGQEHECFLGYELYAPLAFGKDLKLSLTSDIDDIGINLEEYGIRSAKVMFELTNTIPLDFNLSASALDSEGNIVEGINLELSDKIKPGKLDSPSITPVTITLSTDQEGLKFNALRLAFEATCPTAEHQGVALNKNQGIDIKNLAINLPDGIEVDIAKILNQDPNFYEE